MKYSYFGNCKDTVDVMAYWDTTEMAQVVDNSKPYPLAEVMPFVFDTSLKKQMEKYPDRFECGIHKKDNPENDFSWNCDIAWIYNDRTDTHYFFDCY